MACRPGRIPPRQPLDATVPRLLTRSRGTFVSYQAQTGLALVLRWQDPTKGAAVTPQQRTARASNAARVRWANMTEEDRKKAGVKRARGLAARYGYQLVPIDTTDETED